MVQIDCPVCHTEFQVQPYRVRTVRYCSKNCYNIGRLKGKEINCKICGKLFYVISSKLNRDLAPTCSLACSMLQRGVLRPPVAFRFWRHVEISGSCWLWMGARDKLGYGSFCKDTRTHTSITAHRFCWILMRGDIPDDIFVCHNCPGGDNPSCVRPDHMFIGTQGDNIRDAVKKGKMSRPCETNNAAKLTNDQVCEIRRLCLAGTSQRKIAKQFLVTQANISGIARGLTWTDLLTEESKQYGAKDKTRRGEQNHLSKLTEKDVMEIHRLIAIGMLQVKIAKQFNISTNTVYYIKTGRAWKHILPKTEQLVML